MGRSTNHLIMLSTHIVIEAVESKVDRDCRSNAMMDNKRWKSERNKRHCSEASAEMALP
ncbi:hypothetical protein H4F17_09395 [Vibrio cholerae]